jgi:hypothetical protein
VCYIAVKREPSRMATRTPLREGDRSRAEHEHHHGLLERAEEWAEETGLAAEGEPGYGRRALTAELDGLVPALL